MTTKWYNDEDIADALEEQFGQDIAGAWLNCLSSDAIPNMADDALKEGNRFMEIHDTKIKLLKARTSKWGNWDWFTNI